MRKINMKRKSRKEKADQAKNEEENGVTGKSSDPNDSSDEAEDSEVETKKKKSEKRSSVSFSNKKSAKKDAEDDENGAENSDAEPDSKKRKSDKRKSVSFSNKKALKKDAEEEPEEKEESEEDAEYEVEEVLDEKLMKGVRHYLIRWKGYEPESDSWEPESTLDCADLIKKFRALREDKGNSDNSPSKKSKKVAKKVKKSKEKKNTKSDQADTDWDSNDEFEVDRIIDVYFKRGGKREFLVSWKGYPASQDSWEPEENLECQDLIVKFMAKVDAAKKVEQKELRLHRTPTERFTLSMYSGDATRRLSRRFSGKQRVQYHDAE